MMDGAYQDSKKYSKRIIYLMTIIVILECSMYGVSGFARMMRQMMYGGPFPPITKFTQASEGQSSSADMANINHHV